MKVGLIGLGAMGSAMARIILEEETLAIFSRTFSKVERFTKEVGGKGCQSLQKLAQSSDVILLAVKPKELESVAEELDPLIKNETVLISILGGVSIETLKENFSNGVPFRVMPNLPLLCKKGMLGIAIEEGVDQRHKETVQAILSRMGTVAWIEERLMNAFAALTGSNPALIALIVEAMVEAGILLGFKAEISQDFVLKTIEGTIALLQQGDLSTLALRHQVCSPGGTSIVGIEALEKEGVRYGLIEGIKRIAHVHD